MRSRLAADQLRIEMALVQPGATRWCGSLQDWTSPPLQALITEVQATSTRRAFAALPALQDGAAQALEVIRPYVLFCILLEPQP